MVPADAAKLDELQRDPLDRLAVNDRAHLRGQLLDGRLPRGEA